MSKESTIAGLDVGTYSVRTVVAKIKPDQIKPEIIGYGEALSFGLRKGVVVDVEETTKSISQSVQEAERLCGLPVERVYVSLGGSHIMPKTSRGVVAVSRADGEVSIEDIGRAVNAASAISISQNREILHVIPHTFTLDSQTGIKDPAGMSGIRLEVEAMLIEGSSPNIKNLTKSVIEAGLEIEDIVMSPLAASRAALSKRQKELGAMILDFGGGTVDLAVFEEGNIIHSSILPIGSSHITNDIAIGLRTNVDLAEKVKLEYGLAVSGEISKKEMIDLSKLGFENEDGLVPRLEIARIIEARLGEILELINKELKKIDRQGLLPAGVVLVGAGAKMPALVDLVKEELRLPAQIGFPMELEGLSGKIDDPSFATAIGLILWGADKQIKSGIRARNSLGGFLPIRSAGSKIKQWVKSFLP